MDRRDALMALGNFAGIAAGATLGYAGAQAHPEHARSCMAAGLLGGLVLGLSLGVALDPESRGTVRRWLARRP